MVGEAFAAENSAAKVSFLHKKPLTVLFTSDLHSKFDNVPQLKFLIDARRRIAEERGDAVVVVDAGDIAMGSIYNVLFSSSAPELLSLGMLGYDAVCFGNHDFDYGTDALAKMLSSADSISLAGSVRLPAFLNANLIFDNHNLNSALRRLNSTPDTIVVSNGVKVGIIGSVGEDCFATIADTCGIKYISQKERVARLAADLKERGADYVVVLSHSGTYSKRGSLKSKDAMLASSLQGMVDVIISGHDHIPLSSLLKVNGVVLGNAGCYGQYLGELRLNGDTTDYCLLRVEFSGGRDSAVAAWTDQQKSKIDSCFRSGFGVGVQDTVAVLNWDFLQKRDSSGNYPLGNAVAESFRDAAARLFVAAKDSVSGSEVRSCSQDDIVAVVPDGTIRSTIHAGAVTYADCYETLSLGMDSRGRVGYPLVLIYLYGSELYDVAELTPSIGDYMPDAKLSFAGLRYSYNSKRLPLCRVKELFVGKQSVNREKLYPVVGSYYTASLLGLMEESSFGLLKVTPKDCNGNVVTTLRGCILTDSLGEDLVEWKVFADYLRCSGSNDIATESLRQAAFAVNSADSNDNLVWLLYAAVTCAVCAFVVFAVMSVRKILQKGRK